MKNLTTLTSLLVVAGLSAHGVLHAAPPAPTVIYSQDFASGSATSNLKGSSTTKGDGVWVTGWSEIKTDGSAPFGYCYLPFTPEPGKIYTLSVDMVATGPEGGWNAMGFQDGGSETAFNTSGAGWQLVSPGGFMEVRSEGKKIAAGAKIGEGTTVEADSTNTFTIELNTAGDKWVETFLLNGDVMATHTYTTNPDIQYVGIMTNSQPGTSPGKFSGTFSLTEKTAAKATQ